MKLRHLALALCVATAASAQINHRHAQSPVQDQGNRGTCVAFAICAALETFPGVPTDISEQLLYATVKLHENDVDKWLRKLGKQPMISVGNKLENYVRLFDLVGTSHEQYLPYDPNPKKAGPNVPAEIRRYLELAQIREDDLQKLRDRFGKYGFKASDCEVLKDDAAKDVARIKKELDDGRLAIPVSYALYGPKWSSADDDPNRPCTMIHPGLMWQYQVPGGSKWLDYGAAKLLYEGLGLDFVEGVKTGKIKLKQFPDPKKKLYGGHAVTIVGYDKRGFLVKNSWGMWGDEGYCIVNFDYHALLATRALLIDKVYIRTPVLSPFDKESRPRNADFRLKVQYRRKAGKPELVFSTWAMQPLDPDYGVVEYDVQGVDKDGKWTSRVRRVVSCGGTESRDGAPMVLQGAQQLLLTACKQLRVTARYGRPQKVDPNKLDAVVYEKTVDYRAFSPWLKSAIDLLPR